MVVIVFKSWENFERQCRSALKYYKAYFYYEHIPGRVDLYRFDFEIYSKIFRFCTSDSRYIAFFVKLVKDKEPDQLRNNKSSA